ncbi:hypothetical protein HMI54_008363 [Coelomomyces lativittatus]|nr:hypothetical protein HMI56_002038 [Coelomomyces lativittatus]KAJ1509261.1 hypothetical protein HMI55_000046 [Coelomomyces lativittatus]KAJ1516746.1 hypothetical protein HMI54_008363 [Coelomomyces lativittatus]
MLTYAHGLFFVCWLLWMVSDTTMYVCALKKTPTSTFQGRTPRQGIVVGQTSNPSNQPYVSPFQAYDFFLFQNYEVTQSCTTLCALYHFNACTFPMVYFDPFKAFVKHGFTGEYQTSLVTGVPSLTTVNSQVTLKESFQLLKNPTYCLCLNPRETRDFQFYTIRARIAHQSWILHDTFFQAFSKLPKSYVNEALFSNLDFKELIYFLKYKTKYLKDFLDAHRGRLPHLHFHPLQLFYEVFSKSHLPDLKHFYKFCLYLQERLPSSSSSERKHSKNPPPPFPAFTQFFEATYPLYNHYKKVDQQLKSLSLLSRPPPPPFQTNLSNYTNRFLCSPAMDFSSLDHTNGFVPLRPWLLIPKEWNGRKLTFLFSLLSGMVLFYVGD